MEKNNYLLILDWMFDDLELKGNELLVYAVIYGFSQDGESMMKGGLNYMSSRLHITRNTVISALSSLVKKNLIERIEVIDETCKRVYYRVKNGEFKNCTKGVQNFNQGGCKTLTNGGAKIEPSNKYKEINKGNKEKNISPYRDIQKVPEEQRAFYQGMIDNYPNVCNLEKPLTYEEFNKVAEQFERELIVETLQSMENTKPLTKKYNSAYLTLLKWCKIAKDNKK